MRFVLITAPTLEELTEYLNAQTLYCNILDIREYRAGYSAILDFAPIELMQTFDIIENDSASIQAKTA